MRTSSGLRACKILAVFAIVLVAGISGCVSKPGTRSSIWPTQSLSGDSATSTMGQAFSSTTKTVKGQFASMGAAVSSAYSKTKTAIVAPFSSTSTSEPTDPSTGLAKPVSVAPELLVAQGNFFESQGNYAKAMDSYSKALESDSKNPSALMSMARLYENQKETDKAIEYYQKTIQAVPSQADAHANLGSLYATNGNLKAARESMQKAVNLQPKNKSYRSSLAGVKLDSGDAEGALAELQQVETPAMAQYQMAYLNFTRKNIPLTQQYLNGALQIDPNLKPARELMASMGASQNLNLMVQQGQQLGQQASGIYQQAGMVANNVSNLMSTQPQAGVASTGLPPASGYMPPNTQLASPNGSASRLPALPSQSGSYMQR